MTKDKTNDMTVGNPVSLIIRFMIPMCLGNIFQQFYNIADSIVAGQFLGVDALAAIGSTGSLMFFVTGCGNKKFDLYQGSQDIKITRKSDSGTARINFSDTYKKGGEKYFIFTTDITGEQEFTLSEKK